MARVLMAHVVLLLPLLTSAEVTLKHGSLEVKVPANATQAQQKQALLEAFSAQEEELANTMVNDISTHQWSLMVEEYGEPKPRVKGEAKVEAWYINEGKETDKARCIEKQLKGAGFAPLRFEAVGHSNEDLEGCLTNGVDEEGMKGLSKREVQRELRNWCSHKHLFNALSSAEGSEGVDYFIVFEDSAGVHDRNLKPMADALIKDLSDPTIAKFANVPSFDFIQLDPYGGVAFPVGFYQGRPLYHPSADKIGASAGAYKGSHALLVKRSAVGKLHDWMSKSKAMKMDAVPEHMAEFIAVGAGVAVNAKSPFYLTSTASKACHAPEPQKQNLFELGPDAVKAWWLPKEEPKQQTPKKELDSEHKDDEELNLKEMMKTPAKPASSFLR